MNSFNRKAALAMGTVSLALACLTGAAAWLAARENAEDTYVTQVVEESRRLLQHDAFRPEGAQATMRAQAAAQALVGGLFDIAWIYTANGVLMTEQMTPAGSTLEKDIAPHDAPAYRFSFYESQRLPGDRRVLRVFVPLRSGGETTSAYFEGVRLVPDWQLEQVNRDALKVAVMVMVALAALLCAGALYAAVIRLFSDNQRRTREVLEAHLSMMEALGRAIGAIRIPAPTTTGWPGLRRPWPMRWGCTAAGCRSSSWAAFCTTSARSAFRTPSCSSPGG